MKILVKTQIRQSSSINIQRLNRVENRQDTDTEKHRKSFSNVEVGVVEAGGEGLRTKLLERYGVREVGAHTGVGGGSH